MSIQFEELKKKDEEICQLRNHNMTRLNEVKSLNEENKNFKIKKR